MQLQINRIHDAFAWLEREFKAGDHVQSIDIIIHKLDLLCSSLPFVNSQMAVAKRILSEKKVAAYHSLQASSASQEKYYAPSLAKDYINARCSEEEFNYDLCERLSRSIVHIIDAQRSCLSALKQEAAFSNFSNHS